MAFEDGWLIVKPGLTLSPEAEMKLLDTSGVTLATADGKSDNKFLIGAEYRARLRRSLFLSTSLDYTQFKTKEDPSADSLFSSIVTIGGESDGPVKFWGGMGVGLSLYMLGESARTQNGVTLALDKSSTGLALMPSAGVDFESGGNRYGVQFGFWTADFSFDGTASSAAGKAKFEVNLIPAVYMLQLRVGFDMLDKASTPAHAAPAPVVPPAPAPEPTPEATATPQPAPTPQSP
jgi:hypothetical protein